MDPVTITAGFSTIVGLIGMYRAERKGRSDDDYEHFIAWLQTHRFDQLVELILDDHQIGNAIRGTLSEQHDTIMRELRTLNSLCVQIGEKISSLNQLAVAMPAPSVLSDQAISILQQLNARGASKLYERHDRGGLGFWSDNQGDRTVHLTDQRFAEDDVLRLCELGLLRLSYGDGGRRLFHITRAGAEFRA